MEFGFDYSLTMSKLVALVYKKAYVFASNNIPKALPFPELLLLLLLSP